MSRSPEILARLPVKTKHGTFVAHYSEGGLAALDFPANKPIPDLPPLPKSALHFTQVSQWHEWTAEALHRVLVNKSVEKLPPLDWRSGTEFQQRVWNALRKIKSGSTVSYGELAASLGARKAVRAVGGACGANPIPVLIPCHRVLAADKKIGGFSGGLDWKRLLLSLESPELFTTDEPK